MAKWAIELAAHSILYEPRTAIKSQILDDFFDDWAETEYMPPCSDRLYLRLHFDGSKMKEGLGAGIVLTSPKGDRLEYALQIHFKASNLYVITRIFEILINMNKINLAFE